MHVFISLDIDLELTLGGFSNDIHSNSSIFHSRRNIVYMGMVSFLHSLKTTY